MTTLQLLFIELVQIHLSDCVRVSKCMLQNTIQFFASLKGFDHVSIEQWYVVCSNAGIKYNV